MTRAAVIRLCLIAAGLLGSSLPARTAGAIRSPGDAVAACEKSAYGADGNHTDEYQWLSADEKRVLLRRTFDCDQLIRSIAARHCPYEQSASNDYIRNVIADVGRAPSQARAPFDKFVRNVVVRLPGCTLTTCASNRLSYVSEDGRQEFIVTATGRGVRTRAFAGGELTSQLSVQRGLIGSERFYVVDEVYLRNTENESPGTTPPIIAAERFDPAPYEIRWRAWAEPYQAGKSFYIHMASDGAKRVIGRWMYKECRGGARCPAGWTGSCDGPRWVAPSEAPAPSKAIKERPIRSSSDPTP